MIKPLGTRVIVKTIEKVTERSSGLIIPENAAEKPQEGEVMAVGTGKDVKVGDRVLYGKYSGTEIKIEEKSYLIMHEEDVMGILE